MKDDLAGALWFAAGWLLAVAFLYTSNTLFLVPALPCLYVSFRYLRRWSGE